MCFYHQDLPPPACSLPSSPRSTPCAILPGPAVRPGKSGAHVEQLAISASSCTTHEVVLHVLHYHSTINGS